MERMVSEMFNKAIVSTKRMPPSEFDFSKVKPIEVRVEGPTREDFEFAARRFKALFQKERVVGQLKERSQFEKPSMKKRRKAREAHDRQMLMEMRDRLIKSGEWERIQKKRLQSKLTKEERRAQEVLDATE